MTRENHELFSIDTNGGGANPVVVLRGEFDIAAEDEVSHALARALAARPASLTVDLRELTFLDSTGLRVLLRLRQRCVECACRLSLIRGDAPVDRVFEVSGVGTHFAIVDAHELLAPAAV